MAKINVLVLFGGRSPEHEISIISGIQVLHALSAEKYHPIPVYVNKDGEWILGDKEFYNVDVFKNQQKLSRYPKVVLLPDATRKTLCERPGAMTFFKSLLKDEIDVIFPVFHGGVGENGGMQGLFELTGIPYVGCDTQASSIAMDKVVSKQVAASVGIPVLAGNWLNKSEWTKNRISALKYVMQGLSYPVFVKPVHLGSSIAIGKAEKKQELEDALEVAFHYETKVMVESALKNPTDVNISLTGNYPPYEFSVTEQPMKTGKLLSFEDKYIAGNKSQGMAGSKRIMPAQIKKTTEDKIKDYATKFFNEIGGSGISRIDFLISADETKVYFNEINPMPGSVAFYLWKEAGVNFTKLTDTLISLALEKHKEKLKLTTTFKSNALSGFSGAKGKA